MTIYEGVIIDINRNRIKEFNSYFGIQYGLWKDLPEVNFILIRQLTETITDYKGRKRTSKVCKVFLISRNRGENILIHEALNKEEAINIAYKLRQLLKVSVKLNLE